MRGNISDREIRMLRLSVNNRRGVQDEDTERFEVHVKKYALPYLNLDRSMVFLKKA
jgi:hypothetical protein